MLTNVNGLVPQKVFFVKGVGVHKDKLASFEAALRSCGIEKFNLVYVSSIFPPNCKIVTPKDGLACLDAGQIVFCVMARMETNEPNRWLSSSVGLAVPADKTHYGYLSEHHSYGENAKTAGDYAEDLAATMLATTLGVAFDPALAWDERKNIYKASGHKFKTRNICQAAKGDPQGLWTTTLAAAVFVL